MAHFIQTPPDRHVPPPCKVTHFDVLHFDVPPPCKSMKSLSLRSKQVPSTIDGYRKLYDPPVSQLDLPHFQLSISDLSPIISYPKPSCCHPDPSLSDPK